MSVPVTMPCLDAPCLMPVACQFAGSCRHRRIDAARSYDVGVTESRRLGIADPFKDKEES